MKQAVSSETLTVSTTAVALTAAKYQADKVDTVEVFVEGAIRYWTSGLAPTSTTGIPLLTGSVITIPVNEAQGFKAIRSGSTDAKIHVQYFRTV